VIDRLPPEPELGSHVVEVRFTKALVGEQLLRGLQYLLPPAGGIAGVDGVEFHTVGSGTSGITNGRAAIPRPSPQVR